MKRLVVITGIMAMALVGLSAVAQDASNNGAGKSSKTAKLQRSKKPVTKRKTSPDAPASANTRSAPNSGDAASSEAGSLSVNKGMKHPSADPYSRNKKKDKAIKPAHHTDQNDMGSITGNATGTASNNGIANAAANKRPASNGKKQKQ
jgi:hypothetical protein